MKIGESGSSQGRRLSIPNNFYGVCLLSLFLTLIFAVFYGGANSLASFQPRSYFVHLPFEVDIPFLPGMSIVYLSIQLLLALPLLVFRRTDEFLPFFWTMVFEIVVASVIFVLVPVRSGFPVLQPAQQWAPFFDFADAINLENNFFPSLHVAFAFTAAWVVGRRTNHMVTVMLAAWASVIAVSTVLTHQHHILDVVGGILLCAVAMQWVYLKLEKVYQEAS